MKVKYVGENSKYLNLTDGVIYECVEVDYTEPDFPLLRIIDDDIDDIPYESPIMDVWKPGYLYSPINPAPMDGSSKGGKWELVEDDEKGTLAKALAWKPDW